MHPRKLEELREQLFALAREVMDAKQKEYATPDNCLNNFDFLAKESGRSPESHCFAYMMKHVLSIGSLVKKIDAGGYWNAICEGLTEKPEGRLMDIINYAIFFYAMFERRKKGVE